MKQFIFATITLVAFSTSSVTAIYAAPSAARAQPPMGAPSSRTPIRTEAPKIENDPNYYISLHWLVYMMILSLPFAPSQTHYAPLNIPVSIPNFRLPEPKLSPPIIPKLKTPPPIKVPKLKQTQP